MKDSPRILGITLASLFRGNIFLATLGTWISNPITYLPLYWLNYRIGTILIGKQENMPNISNLNPQIILDQGSDFLIRIILGSSMMGLIAAISTGAIAYKLLRSNTTQGMK